MAKPGKKVSPKIRAAIRLKYEAGLMSVSEIAKHYDFSREAISRMAKRERWQRGKITTRKVTNGKITTRKITKESVTAKITERAVDKLVEKEGDRLFNYASKYVENIKSLDKAHILNLKSYTERSSNGDVSMAEANMYKTIQQFLKLSAETFKINFEGIRLAMGLGKEDGRSVEINNSMAFGSVTKEDVYVVKAIFDGITIND